MISMKYSIVCMVIMSQVEGKRNFTIVVCACMTIVNKLYTHAVTKGNVKDQLKDQEKLMLVNWLEQLILEESALV